ncbi:hypothetical protein [Nostoc sp. LEGE 12450]|uniref:hypothetical protein n=1 Tax=Nostoc sp. LEGE 12450 TaxID=1828643 RepID=UPI00187F2ED7|nr:hypothetical protein [Nostoc sp. LEGE 12450]MBE8988340.1 hypothetical protein [Nostoc sp. LEGE 12450]
MLLRSKMCLMYLMHRWAIAKLAGRCDRFIISSHEIQQVQKPPSALGFGLILFACPWSH